jgi:hypothetical protein
MHHFGQAVGTRDRANDDIPAIPAISAVGTASGDVFLAAKAATSASAVAAFHVESYAINEHGKRAKDKGPSYAPDFIIKKK